MIATPSGFTVQTRFGTFPAQPADVVTVIDGIAGFERCHRFVLVSSPDLAPFTCVQGLDAPRPSFLAIAPRLVVAQYAERLTLGDRLRLDMTQDEPLLWLAFVRLMADAATVNLRAPLVINPRRMIGLQLMAAESDYALDHPLVVE
jgi:flagellar assembly factor FliW